MLKAWLHTKPRGFSTVEALLAVAVFGLLVMGIGGGFIYGRESTAGAGDHERAAYIAEEGIEAVRNIRNAGYSNLVNGTYGLVQSGGVWTLSGVSDTTDIYTRAVTIADGGSNRKNITSTVSWGTQGRQSQVVSLLSNWSAALAKSWANPSQYAGLNLTGTIAAYKVDTVGSYAYLVRNSATGPNFFVINISTPTAPTVAGTLTLAGTPTNISVSGNYAYVSNAGDTTELQIVNISNPASPTLAGTYNASGNGNGLSVFTVGTTAYLSRAANGASDEFVIVNASNPASPTRTGGYALNVSMNEVFVSGSVAYVATSSDTQELLVINMVFPSTLSLGTAVNLPGTTDAATVSGYGTTIVVGQGAILYSGNFSTPLIPVLGASVTLPGTIYDIDASATNNYAFAGVNATSGEFQVVNVVNPASPTILSSVNTTSTLNLTGVAYNPTLDVVAGATSNTSLEAIVFGPN